MHGKEAAARREVVFLAQRGGSGVEVAPPFQGLGRLGARSGCGFRDLWGLGFRVEGLGCRDLWV